jgi:hypothetical protein
MMRMQERLSHKPQKRMRVPPLPDKPLKSNEVLFVGEVTGMRRIAKGPPAKWPTTAAIDADSPQ